MPSYLTAACEMHFVFWHPDCRMPNHLWEKEREREYMYESVLMQLLHCKAVRDHHDVFCIIDDKLKSCLCVLPNIQRLHSLHPSINRPLLSSLQQCNQTLKVATATQPASNCSSFLYNVHSAPYTGGLQQSLSWSRRPHHKNKNNKQ